MALLTANTIADLGLAQLMAAGSVRGDFWYRMPAILVLNWKSRLRMTETLLQPVDRVVRLKIGGVRCPSAR